MRKAVVFLISVVVALAIFETARHFEQRGSNASGDPSQGSAPDLVLTDLDGNHFRTADYKGKVVLVNFWAAWCVPCTQEIPQFIDLQEKYRSKLQIIGISIDDNESDLRNFYKSHNMNYPVVRGNQQIADGYGGVPGLPTTYIIDQDIHVRGRQVGATDFEKLQQKITSLFK